MIEQVVGDGRGKRKHRSGVFCSSSVRIVRGFLCVGLLVAGAATHARGSERASGSLRVTAVIQSSLGLTVRSSDGRKLVAGGNQQASVTVYGVGLATGGAPGGVSTELDLAVLARVANFPNSSGYTLVATWQHSGMCALKMDGILLAPNSPWDVTLAKVLGDPYGAESKHRILILHPANDSPQPCSGDLILTARPKL